MNVTTISRARGFRRSGFTLIELLTVIGIIALLAGIIIPLAGVANKLKRNAEARALIDMVDTAITQYKNKKGFYPPDNTVSGVTKPFPNPLFYELWGATVVNPATPITYGDNYVAGDSITADKITSFFNVGGFMNASADSTEIYSFLPTLKKTQVARLNPVTQPPQPPVWVLACQSAGPPAVMTTNNGIRFNQVQYVVNNPTNRPGFYDLWVDIIVGGKTNRISNWSKDPVPVAY